ncbi:MAG: S9 family peptidase, partial [candidate division KSB1 bacterium]|nr:S9 family peptidase [candidate division KSB1 bacterium]
MRKYLIFVVLFVISTGLVLTFTQCAKEGKVISREVLFGNPDKASLRVSPNHQHISYLAPLDGVMNVWVAPIEDPGAAVAVTKDTLRGIRIFFWAYNNEQIIYLQDLGGDENWQVHAVNVETKEDINLTPFEEIVGPDNNPITLPNGKKLRPRAQIQEVSYKFPNEILVGLNNRNPQFHDIYQLNILSGDLELIQQNDRFMGFQTDDNYKIRYALQMTPDGGNEIFVPTGKNKWKSFDKIPMEDMLTTSPITFDKTGDILYMIDSRGRNTAALVSVDLKSGEKKVIYEDPKADLSNIMIHPIDRTIEAAASEYLRTEWTVLDESIKADLDYLRTVADGDINVTSRSLDDNVWTVAYVKDDGPVNYYLYDRTEDKAEFMFTNRTKLEGLSLSKMHPVIIESRDGKELVSYLTLPFWTDEDNNARPDQPLPMVLFVHGGPWARDSWGYHSYH